MPKLYRSVANTTVDANGNASFSFEQISMNSVWMGSIIIPSAKSASVLPVQWNATDLGVAGTSLGYPVASWWNNLSSGTIQAVSQLNVTGSGLAPGSLQAFFQGYVYNYSQETPPPWWPEPTPAPPPSQPQLLLSETISLTASPTTLGTFPVIVGTSISVAVSSQRFMRLTLNWLTPPSSVVMESFTFDIPSGFNALEGLVLPNVGPQLQVLGIASSPGIATIQIFTGLPPITQRPVVPSGMLWSSSGTIAAGGFVNVPLLPYYGPVSFTFSPNNVTGFGVYITSTDYLGNNPSQIRNTQGWPAGTGPFFAQEVIYLPALPCTLTADNTGVGSPTTYSTTGVTLGPDN